MKIFIGNFSTELTENDLFDLFSIFGKVESTTIIYDKYTGESRGFGYVIILDPKQAQTAILRLNGKEIKGKKLHVNEARTQSKGYPGQERRKSVSGSDQSK